VNQRLTGSSSSVLVRTRTGSDFWRWNRNENQDFVFKRTGLGTGFQAPFYCKPYPEILIIYFSEPEPGASCSATLSYADDHCLPTDYAFLFVHATAMRLLCTFFLSRVIHRLVPLELLSCAFIVYTFILLLST